MTLAKVEDLERKSRAVIKIVEGNSIKPPAWPGIVTNFNLNID